MNHQSCLLRHVQPFILLLLIMSMFVESHPAAAQTANGPESIGVCARLPDRLTTHDVYWIRSRLAEIFPAQQAASLSKIRIEEDFKDNILGPEFRKGEGEERTLLLPPAFMRRLCHQILLQTVYSRKFDAVSDMNVAQLRQMRNDATQLVQKINQCRSGGGTQPQCLDQEILSYLRLRGEVADDDKLSFARDDISEDDYVVFMAYGAAEFFIAHEATHAIRDAILSKSYLGKSDPLAEEVEADLYALQHLFGQSDLPLAPMMVMAATSLVEQEQSAEARHLPDTCRMKYVRASFQKMAPLLYKLSNFMAGDQFFGDEADAAALIRRASDLPVLFNPSLADKCGEVSNAYVNEAIDDLNQFFDPIFVRFDGFEVEDFKDLQDLDSEFEDVKIKDFVRKFETRRWKSHAGQKIAAKYLYNFLVGANTASLEDSARDLFEGENSRRAEKLLNRTVTGLTSSYQRIGPEWFGHEQRVLMDIGIAIKKPLLNEAKETLLSEEKESEKVKIIVNAYLSGADRVLSKHDFDLPAYLRAHADFDNISPVLAEVYFPQYSEFLDFFRLQAQAELIFGDCDDPKFLASTVINRVWSQFPDSQIFNKAMCKERKAEAEDWLHNE